MSTRLRPVTIHFDNMVAGVVQGGGIDPARLDGGARAGGAADTGGRAGGAADTAGRAGGAADATGRAATGGDLARRFRHAFDAVRSRRASGDLGFLDLPADRTLAARTREVADALGHRRFDNVVVIGIGGSALGAAALRDALLSPGWNELEGAARGHRPRLHILDNPDPDSTAALLGRLDLARTLFNVVSKSGSTTETLALFLAVWGRLEEALGPGCARDHVVVTTDARRGFLRGLAEERGLPSLPVPGNVGGRFSVLSPVGLLPAALAGIDTEALLDGASAMAARCGTPILLQNPAGTLATLLHAADVDHGAGIHVFMPYADALGGVARWAQQLWAESLGKARRLDGTRAETGPTPLPARGASDQHSLLQLFMEGPRDKVVVFLGRAAPARDVAIPSLFPDNAAVSYLGDHTLFELLDRERIATAEALRRAGRLNVTAMVDRVDARSVGALLMLFQIAAVHAGALYGVDPMDQPGVELGKSLTSGLMGRPGHAPPVVPPPDARWRV